MIRDALESFWDEVSACVVESIYNRYWLVDPLMDDGFGMRLGGSDHAPGALLARAGDPDARSRVRFKRLGLRVDIAQRQRNGVRIVTTVCVTPLMKALKVLLRGSLVVLVLFGGLLVTLNLVDIDRYKGQIDDHVNPGKKASDSALLVCAAVRFDIEDGIAKTRKVIALQTDRTLLVGDGNIDLKTEKISLQLCAIAAKGSGVGAGDLTRGIGVDFPTLLRRRWRRS
jgi:hypothetical protein